MVTIEVEGMTCGHCAATVKKAIAAVDPAAKVDVDLPSREVRIEGDADPSALRKAIEDAGYRPVG